MTRYEFIRITRIPGRAVPAGYRLLTEGETIGIYDIRFCAEDDIWRACWLARGRVLPHGWVVATKSKKLRLPKPGTPHRYSSPVDEASVPLRRTENNDCAVVALHHATGLPYRDCHAFWELHGRKHGRGTRVCGVLPWKGSKEFPELGIRVTCAMHSDFRAPVSRGAPHNDEVANNAEPARLLGEKCGAAGTPAPTSWETCLAGKPTIAAFAKARPVGRWFVCTHDHALAVVDGVVVDGRRRFLCRLSDAWLVTPL